MDVKHAVSKAKSHVMELFADEKPADIGLEEVEFKDDTNEWRITIGFTRPWDRPKNLVAELAEARMGMKSRSYKVVCISDGTGEVIALKNYETQH